MITRLNRNVAFAQETCYFYCVLNQNPLRDGDQNHHSTLSFFKSGIFRFHIKVILYSICLFLTYFTQHGALNPDPTPATTSILGTFPIILGVEKSESREVSQMALMNLFSGQEKKCRSREQTYEHSRGRSKVSERCSVLSDSLQPHGLQPPRFLCPWNSPGQNTGVGSPSLLQGIFQTQGSNPGLPHCRRILQTV